MKIALLCLLCAPLAVLAAPAKKPKQKTDDSAPSGTARNMKELARVQISCHFIDARGNFVFPAKTNAIRCDFVFVDFSIPTPDEIAQAEAKAAREFDSGWTEEVATKGEAELMEFKKNCAATPADEMSKFVASEKQRLAGNKYASSLSTEVETAEAMRKGCSCTSLSCLHDAMRSALTSAARRGAEACTIFASQWTLDFRHDGDQWIDVDDNPLTRGSCNSSITTTLSPSKQGDGSSYGWDLRIIKVPKPGATEMFGGKNMCSGQVETSFYSGNLHGYGLISLSCTILEL